MKTTSSRGLTSLMFSTMLLAGACSGGGGGGGGTPEMPSTPSARVPEGTGIVPIQMTGLWEISDAVVIETNSPNPVPPLNGTVFQIGPDGIETIAGLSVEPDFLEVLLGAPLESYVNELDGRTLMYAVVVDRRATGGTREAVAVAGGAFDPDAISVEALSSSQSPTDSEPVYTLSRYSLVRLSSAAGLGLADELPPEAARTLQQVFAKAFGQR